MYCTHTVSAGASWTDSDFNTKHVKLNIFAEILCVVLIEYARDVTVHKLPRLHLQRQTHNRQQASLWTHVEKNIGNTTQMI